jgi:hypothetical protein
MWVLFFTGISLFSVAQDSTQLFFVTGAGIIQVRRNLSDALKSTIAFNSGFELNTAKKLFVQLTADLNAFRYNQRLTDPNSPFLIHQSTSTLFMAGLNGGKSISLGHDKSITAYIGAGYLTIGEPRIIQEDQILHQHIFHRHGVFKRAGVRFAIPSPLKFLQVLYLDTNYWGTRAVLQGHQLGALSIFIGSRMKI